MKDTTINHTAAGKLAELHGSSSGGGSLAIIMENSTVISSSATGGFYLYGGSSEYTFDIDGTSAININGGTAKELFLIYYPNTKFNLNLAENATLKLETTEPIATYTVYEWENQYQLDTFTQVKYNDGGAEWVFGANAQKGGVNFSPFMGSNGVSMLVTTVGNDNVGAFYKDENATADVTFKYALDESDQSQNPDNVAYVKANEEADPVYYTSFVTAIELAESGSVVVLLKDITLTDYVGVKGKSLTIDGNGKKISADGFTNYFLGGEKSADSTDFYLTLKNATVDCTQGIWFNIDEINVENCAINGSHSNMLRNSPVAGQAVTVNIKDTVWNYDSENVKTEPFMLAGTGVDSDITVNIMNSQIYGATGVAPAEGAAVNVFNHNNGLFNLFTAGEIKITLDETSKIATTGAYTGSIFALHETITQSFVLELAEGATLELTDIATNGSFIVNYTDTVVIDNGAKWVLGVAALANGAILPTITVDGKTMLGWSDGAKLVKDGVVYSDANATEAAAFTTKYFTNNNFYMTEGAAIRTQNGSGIRFSVNVSAEFKALLGDGVKFGTLVGNVSMLGDGVAPTLEALINAGEAVQAVNIEQKKWANTEETKYCAAIINISDTAYAYQVKLAGRGYMTVTYADGSEVTYYTDFNETDNVRSMYDVAVNLTNKGKGTAVTEAIISAVAAPNA